MKNLKKLIATILITTLVFGCVNNMSAFAGEPDDWFSPSSTSAFGRVSDLPGEISTGHKGGENMEECPAVRLDSSDGLPFDEGFGLPQEERGWLGKYNFGNVDTESCMGFPVDIADLPAIREVTTSPADYYSSPFMEAVPNSIKIAWRQNPGLMNIFEEFLESTNYEQTLNDFVNKFDGIKAGKVNPKDFAEFCNVIKMVLQENIGSYKTSQIIEILTSPNNTDFTINPAFIWFALSCLAFYAGNIPGDDGSIDANDLFNTTCRIYAWQSQTKRIFKK